MVVGTLIAYKLSTQTNPLALYCRRECLGIFSFRPKQRKLFVHKSASKCQKIYLKEGLMSGRKNPPVYLPNKIMI